MKRVRTLISTLGDTPPVVTEAIDVLKKEGVNINQVVILTTQDASAQETLNLLCEHIPSYYEGSVHLYDWRVTKSYHDINTREAVVEFMKDACGILRDYRKRGHDVYVSIAGGRKTMSALMTLAVQFYGAKELFHIIIDDPELETKSKIDNLRHRERDEQNKILHPDPSLIKLVRMPFIGLFPWISDILKVLKGEPVNLKEIQDLLISNNLIENKKLTKLGQAVIEILEYLETLPDPCPEESQKESQIKISDHHYTKEAYELAEKVIRRFSFICEVRSTNWRHGEPKVKTIGTDLGVYSTRRGKPVALFLKTNAKTEGQAERAKKEVEKFLVEL